MYDVQVVSAFELSEPGRVTIKNTSFLEPTEGIADSLRQLESDGFRESSKAGYQLLRKINDSVRLGGLPVPFNVTRHTLKMGDARDLSWIDDESVDLIVTSPPYWTLKQYEASDGQLAEIDDYEAFLDGLDEVWSECKRVLKKGGRVCCVVGDVCLPRRSGRHQVFPLHSDIQVRARRLGFDCLTPILWHKIANGATEVAGNGSGFYGKPYQPGAIIKNDIEYILFLRKGEGYRRPTHAQRALSMLTKDEMKSWWTSIWSDIPGASTRRGHPAPYPAKLAERLIRMFSFVGDTVLDPFDGTGSTSIAAVAAGRNSIGNELEAKYHELAISRVLSRNVSGK